MQISMIIRAFWWPAGLWSGSSERVWRSSSSSASCLMHAPEPSGPSPAQRRTRRRQPGRQPQPQLRTKVLRLEEAEHRPLLEILSELRAIDQEILQGFEELEGMLR